MRNIIIVGVALTSFALTATSWAWDPDEAEEYHAKAQEAIAEFKESDPTIQRFFDSATGYVVIPTVGKAGFGIGGARGKGVLYENGAVTANVTLSQLSFGFQWGGQAYSEFIFFEDAATLTNFKRGNYEMVCPGLRCCGHGRCVGGCQFQRRHGDIYPGQGRLDVRGFYWRTEIQGRA